VNRSPDRVVIEPIHRSEAQAHRILRCYLGDIVSRYHGREAKDNEVDSTIGADPGDDQAPPRGCSHSPAG
jgi:hypothetical protein